VHTSSWTEFFRELYSAAFRWEQNLHGRHEELQNLSDQILQTILPDLLGRLEDHGRMVRPVLLHGDLHDGNVGLSRRTGRPMIYDPASFYGHHEYELGAWNLERNVIGRAYIDRYLTHDDCGSLWKTSKADCFCTQCQQQHFVSSERVS
jgi:protein-ribulosamine 3-kinase